MDKKACPACKEKANITFVFTFRNIICSTCGINLKVDEPYRLAIIFSSLILSIWYGYILYTQTKPLQVIVWTGLALIMLPFIIISKRKIIVLGNQQEKTSTALNISFIVSISILIYLSLNTP